MLPGVKLRKSRPEIEDSRSSKREIGRKERVRRSHSVLHERERERGRNRLSAITSVGVQSDVASTGIES